MPFLLPFISFLFCLKTRTAPHILAEKKRHIQIASLLVSLLLIHYRDTRISEASLTKSYWWLTTSQRRCGKNNLQREEDDADSCSYLKDKARVGCRDHQRGGDKKKGQDWIPIAPERLDTFYSPTWSLKNTDSLRRTKRIRGWWSSTAWFENQVVRLGLAGGLYLSTTDGVKCWMLKNRWTSKLIKPGSWVKSAMPRMRENAPPNQEICGGKVILNAFLNFMLLQDASNFAVNKVSFHGLGINNTIQGLFCLCEHYCQSGMFLHFPFIALTFSLGPAH